MAMKNDSKFEEELTWQSNIDKRKSTNFDPDEQSKISKICTLMGFFWTRYIIFELKNVQRSYIWWHWRLMPNLKEKWLVLSKNFQLQAEK